MSGYSYTTGTRQDEAGFDTLTDSQRTLGHAIYDLARKDDSDRYLLLVAADGTPQDKAALAELWGGPGAGREFLR